MIVFNIILSLVGLSVGVDIKIGALFDTNVKDVQQVFHCAVEAANNERLSDVDIKLEHKHFEVPYGNEFLVSKKLCKMLKLGVAAVFGPSAPSAATHCMNICDVKESPYIDVKWDSDTKPPVINLHPHPDTVAQIFVDIIKAFDWKGFTIIYESAPWLPRVAELLKLYDPKAYTVTVRRINIALSQNYRSVLRRVKLSSDTRIVIDCSIEALLPEVLKQAQQVGLMTDYHQFIITSMDMHTIDLEPYQYSGTNITGIRLVDPENPLMEHVTKFMADSRKGSNEEESENEALTPETMTVQSALIFDGVLLLAEAFKQLNVDQLKPKKLDFNATMAWENGNSITNFMRNTVVQGLTGDVKFDNQGLRTNFAVDVVELTSSGIEKVASWNTTEIFTEYYPVVKSLINFILLKPNPSIPRIQWVFMGIALRIMSHLCVNSEAVRQIYTHTAIEQRLIILLNETSDNVLISEAIILLFQITQIFVQYKHADELTKEQLYLYEEILNKRVVDQLVECLTRVLSTTNSREIFLLTMAVFSHISFYECYAFIRHRTLNTLLQAFENRVTNFVYEIAIKDQTLTLLANVSEKYSIQILDSGALVYLINSLKYCRANTLSKEQFDIALERVQIKAATALGNLANEPALAQFILNYQGVRRLVALVKDRKSRNFSDGVLDAAKKALRRIAYSLGPEYIENDDFIECLDILELPIQEIIYRKYIKKELYV